MAKNDVILLDGIIDERASEAIAPGDRGEVFELFVLEELLKDYDLSGDEIESGWIDGRDDGGIDAFYIFINGHLLEDSETFSWPRSHAAIDIWLITCKHHATFSQAPLDSILATIQELFDLSRSKDELHGSYSDDLLDCRSLFHLAYRRLWIGRPVIQFNVVYASRVDPNEIGDSVSARSAQIQAAISGLFSSCSVRFQFIGASEFVALHRKSKTFALNLPFLEHLATGRDSYVLLVRLEDYWRFVSDEKGNLRRYLFDSNVRDFLGANRVNDDIARSLLDEAAPDFWWLNNGVTILATNATIPGKTIQLQDIQSVNGLQTTETVFRHFVEGTQISKDRALLVKIIVSSDAKVRDQIIRATNNQSPVEIAALHSTDKIQRDIEDILERHNWYYERRKNYYRNIGKPEARFVTPTYLASAVVALVLKNPIQARKLKPKLMRNQESYERVFSARFPISVWPVLVGIYKCVDAGLLTVHSSTRRRERFFASWRPFVAFFLVAHAFGKFSFSVEELSQLDVDALSNSDVQDAWGVIDAVQKAWDLMLESEHPRRVKHSFFLACCGEAVARYSLTGLEQLGRHETEDVGTEFPETPLTPEFVNAVDAALPNQPWKPGVHHNIATVLGCRSKRVSAAIQQLIAEGKRYAQRDGVVFDIEGKVLMRDEERLGESTKSL